MGGKFFRWVEKRGFRVEEITEKMVEAFLQEEGIAKEQRYRYVRLIELYYAFLISLGLSVPNPGQQAAVTMIRLLAGPSTLDRLVAVDTMVAVTMCGIGTWAAYSLDTTVTYSLAALALISFVGSVSIARFRVPDTDDKEARTLVQDAEIALAFAKKLGGGYGLGITYAKTMFGAHEASAGSTRSTSSRLSTRRSTP